MSRSRMLSVSLVLLAVAPALAGPGPATPKAPKELLEKRLEAARKVFEQNLLRHRNREALPAELFGWSERWLEAELALGDKVADRVKALKDHLDRTREVERIAVNFARTGQGRQADADAATYYRLEAEIRLERAKAKPAGQAALESPDAVALAESDVAVKRAAVKIAEAQRKVALAKLGTAKAQLAEAQTLESYSATLVRRIQVLHKQGAVEDRIVDEWQAKWEAAKAQRTAAEGKIVEREAHVTVEQARVELAQAEALHAELRLKQLKAPKRDP